MCVSYPSPVGGCGFEVSKSIVFIAVPFHCLAFMRLVSTVAFLAVLCLLYHCLPNAYFPTQYKIVLTHQRAHGGCAVFCSEGQGRSASVFEADVKMVWPDVFTGIGAIELMDRMWS